jgi:hypothetical protein
MIIHDEIDASFQNSVLHYIEEHWSRLSDESRPWGVWISGHDNFSQSSTQLDSIVQSVWFLDKKGIKKRSLWEFARFYTVHFAQPWCSRVEAKTVWGSTENDSYPIGIAAFAPLQEKNSVYIEVQWAGKFGQGSKCFVDESGLVYEQNRLWTS